MKQLFTVEWANGQFLDRIEAESARQANVIVTRVYGLTADQFRVRANQEYKPVTYASDATYNED